MNINFTEGKTRGNVKDTSFVSSRPIIPPKGPERYMKKFLINTHSIDGGYNALVSICESCSSKHITSPIKPWMFEVEVPEDKVNRFRLFINCFQNMVFDLVP
jgi:hypothetical protein